jgi:hypothetical protein
LEVSSNLSFEVKEKKNLKTVEIDSLKFIPENEYVDTVQFLKKPLSNFDLEDQKTDIEGNVVFLSFCQ